MRILGIDPGYAIVGFGILEAQRGQARLLRCGAINTQAGVPMPRRLLQIHEDLETLIKRFAPDVMAIEELFFNTNVTTGIGVAQARGVILMTAAQLGVTVYEYTPSQVKQAVVGYGKAEKRQVMDMTRRAAPSGSCAQAGRRGRRRGHRPVPRPVPHLPAEPAVTGRREFPCFTISRAERPTWPPTWR